MNEGICIYAAYVYFYLILYTRTLWDLSCFSIVLVMPQIHDPDKLDIFAKEIDR